MSKALDRLVEVMARLRDPKSGCPWDLEQNFRTIAPYTLEETYEVVEAIEQNNPGAMKDELGDLLFQIAFHAQMGHEAGLFDLDQIATHVADKMIERHPHVFGDRDAKTAERVLANWETDKAAKREAKAKADGKPASALDGVTTSLPAATRAVKLQNRAARVGFDWTDARDIIAKIKEEIGELEVEIERGISPSRLRARCKSSERGRPRGWTRQPGLGAGQDVEAPSPAKTKDLPRSKSKFSLPLPQGGRENSDAIEDEFGDLFFALINLARRLEVDPETALRRTNRKFERRFREIENRLAAHGRKMADASLDEMEKIWCEVKAEEKRAKKAG